MARQLVLGLGGTVDFEIRWDSSVIESLVGEYSIRRSELSTAVPITDERSLVVVILAFLAEGSGGERFVESSQTVESFAARFATTVTLGGTGVRAGIALDSLGIPSVQHLVSIDDTVRRLLPASTTYISSAVEDTLDPHLIVQYPAGARVRLADGEVVAEHPNRLIFANDPPNREMRLSDDLPEALESARAFLVSGFNTMQYAKLLDARLTTLERAMDRLPPDALVYYEEAGFYDPALAERARARLLPLVDVLGMNEDELEERVGRSVDLLSPSDVAAALVEAHAVIPAPALVVHSKYWAAAVGPDATRHRASLTSAVQMAATRYRLGDGCTAADFAATAALPRHHRGAAVADYIEAVIPGSVAVAAFDLDVAAPTTIGLGDSFVGGFFAALPPVAEERVPRERSTAV
ncbi:ADP-dependent glucokinase/phosphofructokinase [Schumannella luteola]